MYYGLLLCKFGLNILVGEISSSLLLLQMKISFGKITLGLHSTEAILGHFLNPYPVIIPTIIFAQNKSGYIRNFVIMKQRR